jgi:hypothetical protein
MLIIKEAVARQFTITKPQPQQQTPSGHQQMPGMQMP